MSSLNSVGRAAALAIAFSALTIVMLWPLISPGPIALPDSDDAYFSVWRLAWVAHQLPRNPQQLFDANIFYPEPGTLAFSDAMLLLGVIGAPLQWLGVDAALAHNLLLAAAFVSSLYFTFALACKLTGSRLAALLAAIVFGFAPFRFAHIGHLELQWVMWMPLSVLLLHKLMEAPTRGTAMLLGASVAGQTLCSIYYGVFLSCYLAVAWLVLIALHESTRARVASMTGFAVVPLLAVLLIYGPPYSRARAAYGARSAAELSEYSATPSDFLRVPPENRLRGARDGRPAPDERSLYPGGMALVLAAAALVPPVSRMAWVYLGLTAVSTHAALGVNGWLFPGLQQVFPVVTSLRSPTRFGILVLLSVSVLAGLGAARILRARPRYAPAIAAVTALLCLVEYWSAPVTVRPHQSEPTEAHRWLAQQNPGTVVLELPVPTLDALWLYETTYQIRSIHHWQPLVNGYSAFAPKEYTRTLEVLRGFPNIESVQRLRALNVRFVLLNRAYYSGEAFTALIQGITGSPSFWPPRSFGDGEDQIVVAELKDGAGPASK